MLQSSSILFKNKPVSFVENLLTSKFYFKYLCPTGCESESTNNSAEVKGRINAARDLGLKTLSKALSTFGLLSAAPVGAVWNGVCTFGSLIYWGCCVVTRMSKDQLDPIASNTAHYARATFDDITFSALPFVYLTERVVTSQISKLSNYLPNSLFSNSNLPKILFLSRVAFFALGAVVALKTLRVIDERIKAQGLKSFESLQKEKEKEREQLQRKGNSLGSEVSPVLSGDILRTTVTNLEVDLTAFKNLVKRSGDLVAAVKVDLVRMYAEGTLQDLSEENREMPQIKDVWDINILLKYFNALKGKSSDSRVNEAIETIVKNLNKSMEDLNSYKEVASSIPFLSDCVAVDKLVKDEYSNRLRDLLYQTEQELVTEVYMKALFLMFNLRIIPLYCFPFNGNTMAQPLESFLNSAVFNDQKLKQTIVGQVQNLKDIQKKIDLYKIANGDDLSFNTFEEYPILDYIRSQYAMYLEGAEVELIGHINAINRQIAFFASQGMMLNGVPVLPINFALPISAVPVIGLLAGILNTYGAQFQEKSRSMMEEKYFKAFELQKNVESYRSADQFILRSIANCQQPEDCDHGIWDRLQKPTPLSYVNYPKVISEQEYRIVQLVSNLNGKEFQFIRERFKIDVDPIPYTCPLDVDSAVEQIAELIEQFNETLKNEANEDLQTIAQDLSSLMHELDELQQSLVVFRLIHQALSGNQSNQQPSLYMDPKIYEVIFYEGSADSNPIVSEVLDACKLDSEVNLESVPQEYIQFRSRILDYHQALQSQKQPNLMAYHYLGLQGGFTKEELKDAKKTYDLTLHPDKRKGINEAIGLFSCMNELYNICEKMAERSATPMKTPKRPQKEGVSQVRRNLALTWLDDKVVKK